MVYYVWKQVITKSNANAIRAYIRAGQFIFASMGVGRLIDMVKMSPSDLVSSLLIQNWRGTAIWNILTFTSKVQQKNQKSK